MKDFISKSETIKKLNDYAEEIALEDECIEEAVKQCIKIIKQIPAFDTQKVDQ